MADKPTITLEPRDKVGSKQNHKLRAEGRTPGVVYGHGAEAQTVAADSRELDKLYAVAGGSKIIGLKVGDARAKNALIHDVQKDARTGSLIHADFYLVRMDEKIKTEIPLHFVGESTAVYQQEGTMIQPLQAVEIEALPADLPESFEVDISVLDDFDKTITVADLKAPEGVEILTPAEELIAKVEPPRSDEELEELDAEIDEQAEMPEGAVEEEEVVDEQQETRKEPANRDEGVNPS